MEIKFIYSIESEKERVKETLLDKDFFEEHKYQVWLPEGLSLNSVETDITEEQIEKEFDPKTIESKIAVVKKCWEENKEALEVFYNSLGFPVPKEVTIVMTKYAPVDLMTFRLV